MYTLSWDTRALFFCLFVRWNPNLILVCTIPAKSFENDKLVAVIVDEVIFLEIASLICFPLYCALMCWYMIARRNNVCCLTASNATIINQCCMILKTPLEWGLRLPSTQGARQHGRPLILFCLIKTPILIIAWFFEKIGDRRIEMRTSCLPTVEYVL